jgi:GT2 family glycosyltransferase
MTGGTYVDRVEGVKPFVFARNVNLGIHTRKSDVVILNDDATLGTEAGFDYMAAISVNHPWAEEFGVISPTINGPAPLGNPQQRFGALPMERSLAETSHYYLSFVCVYIRREVIERLIAEVSGEGAGGPLDERYSEGYGAEDVDACYRVTRMGMKLGVTQQCVVTHGELPSTFRHAKPRKSLTSGRKTFFEIHGFWPGGKEL